MLETLLPEQQLERSNRLLGTLKRELFEAIHYNCIARISYAEWKKVINGMDSFTPKQVEREVRIWIEKDFWDINTPNRVNKVNELLKVYIECCNKIEAKNYKSNIELSLGEEIWSIKNIIKDQQAKILEWENI